MRRDPYRVVEGLAIAALAVGATDAFLATKRSFVPELAAVRRAALEMGAAGMLGEINLSIVEGPEEYLFGEEKALLEVIEGRDPLPTLLPPWQRGLFATVQLGWEADVSPRGPSGQSNPTLVNNVETLASAAHILARGATWFRSMGTVDSPGTVIVTIVGDVARARVFEVELGTPLSVVLDQCGGPRPGRHFVAAISGVSNPILTADQFDVPLSYEDMEAVGTGLGAAGFAVFDDEADMASVARELSRFLAVESCGQCPPCKLGTGAITAALDRIAGGTGGDRDLDIIGERLRVVTDGNRCYLPVEEQRLVSSLLRAFPEDFAAHIETGQCPHPRPLPIPKVVDITDGEVTYDERQARKRADWTYGE
jgi:NADH-quinone oxidoreductase subunit F